MSKLYITIILLLTSSLQGKDILNNYNLYFFGIVQHFEPTPKTNEGDVHYFAISKTTPINLWELENGLGTYIDSYHIRSYKFFTNISHKEYSYSIFKPLIGFEINYKGKSYTSTKRRIIVAPTIKFRIGKNKGLFTNILVVPKIGTLTNGFTALGFGYKF